MKIADIYNTEQNNNNSIYLHKEGLFLRAYEVSAYLSRWTYVLRDLFCKNIKEYVVNKKHYKIINKDIVYIGFSSTVFDQLKLPEKHNLQRISENILCIKEFNYDNNDFVQWKQNYISKSDTINKKSVCEPGALYNHSIVNKLKSFNVANKTPLECQSFIIELQKEINGSLS